MLSDGLVYLFRALEIQMTHCNGQWKTRDKLKYAMHELNRSLHMSCVLLDKYYNFTVRQCVAWRALCSLRV